MLHNFLMTHKKILTFHVSLSVEDALYDIYKKWAEYSCVGEIAVWSIIAALNLYEQSIIDAGSQ